MEREQHVQAELADTEQRLAREMAARDALFAELAHQSVAQCLSLRTGPAVLPAAPAETASAHLRAAVRERLSTAAAAMVCALTAVGTPVLQDERERAVAAHAAAVEAAAGAWILCFF
jgi:hypothetical protein